jgi:beta-galactosidase
MGDLIEKAARAHTDSFDDGRFERWQDAHFDDSGWKSLRTTRGWEDQGIIDAEGRAYRGLMWYRLTVDLPADAAGKSLWLCAPAVVNEAWVWVNGHYAGHRAHTMPWFRPHPVELEITPMVQPGQRNQITLRVLNNVDVFGASGIYERMFIYARTLASGNPSR